MKNHAKGLPSITMLNSWLLILLAFSFMLSMAAGNILMALILLLWLAEGNFSEKYQQVKHNPFAWTSVAFVGLHFLGLLWTSDWEFAAFVLKKEFKFHFFHQFKRLRTGSKPADNHFHSVNPFFL